MKNYRNQISQTMEENKYALYKFFKGENESVDLLTDRHRLQIEKDRWLEESLDIDIRYQKSKKDLPFSDYVFEML